METSHPSMVIHSRIVGWFQIKDHTVPIDSGHAFCDAPFFVRIGIGYVDKTIYIAKQAAENPCVKRSLLGHEAVHDRINHAALDRFLDRQTSFLAAAMKALKQTPASSLQEAAEHWKVGVAAVVKHLQTEFQHEQPKLAAQANSPAELARLAGDCGGRSGQPNIDAGDAL